MLLVIDIPAFQHRRLIVQQRAVRAAVVLSILPIYRLADGRPAAVSRVLSFRLCTATDAMTMIRTETAHRIRMALAFWERPRRLVSSAA